MATRILLAGATGVVGRRLMPLLKSSGYDVFGTTRRAEKVAALEKAGTTPLVVDVFDALALSAALLKIRPEIIIHQLTDLPTDLDPRKMRVGIERNARIRREGTRNLIDAAMAAGARRFIAQSIAWAYAPGPEPHEEIDPLDYAAVEPRSITVGGVVALESAVLRATGMQPIVLRYGRLYGSGTANDAPPDPRLSVHVDAAARAAFLAIPYGTAGVYNIAEQDAAVTSAKARRDLLWSPNYRLQNDREHSLGTLRLISRRQ